MRLRLALLALVSEGLYLFWAASSRLPVEAGPLAPWYRPALFEATPAFLGAWTLLFVVYALAIRAAARAPERGLVVFLFATSALFRVTLAAWGSFETVDAPSFLGAPGPLALPLADLLSRLPWAPPTTRAAACIGVDLLALALAPRLLRAAGLPAGLVVVQGWSPLLVKEAAATPRLELVLGMAALLLAIRLVQRSRLALSGLVLGLSLGAWPALAAALAAMARLLRARVLLAAAVPLALWAWRPAAAFSAVSELARWPPAGGVGGSLLPCLATLCRLLVTRDPRVPLVVAGALWCAAALVSLRGLKADGSGLPRTVLTAVGLLVFLSPQAMPWSFLPFAYLAAYSENRGWLAFTASAPLSYLALDAGTWSFWLGFAQYFIPYASLTFVWLGGSRARKRKLKAK